MNTQDLLINFQSEIKDVANYANRVGFDLKTGDIKVLMTQWINHTKKLHEDIMDNKEEVIRITKTII